tara:strand:+ start:543 stop:902 length:360 start_codon:yes stop_codon:yes gene_type:complete
MPDWIEDYIQEVGPPLEFRQFAQNATSENIWVNGAPIGIFVYTVCGDTISIHTLWIKKKYRGCFKQACRYMVQWIKEEGYVHVELIADLKVCNLVERVLKIKHKQRIYLTDVNHLMEVL